MLPLDWSVRVLMRFPSSISITSCKTELFPGDQLDMFHVLRCLS